MTVSDTSLPILPAHIETTVQAIADLHLEHQQAATALQRGVERLTAALGQPRAIGLLTAAVICWVSGNVAAPIFGIIPVDPAPFAWLATAVSLAAFYATLLILTTQRRDDQLAQLREQLTLELAILNEQKTAKMIRLMEELRRDHPHLPDRVDSEAEAMALPADPQSVLDAIKETHAGRESETG